MDKENNFDKTGGIILLSMAFKVGQAPSHGGLL